MQDRTGREHEIAILIHGFNENESDMFTLQKHLQSWGYEAVTFDLPLTFSSLEDCVAEFEQQFYQRWDDFAGFERIHLVGHSMGGLLVRFFLARNQVPKLGRCVLIATPNQGTKLADLYDRFFKPLGQIYKAVRAMKTDNINIGDPLNTPRPEIGVIAGNNNKHFFGLLLPGANDGRVEVESAKYHGMTDFVICPYCHREIHHQLETATLVDRFLSSGRFLA